jgi:hypothetical protein
LNTIQLELEDLKELADYKNDKHTVSFINKLGSIRLKKLEQSCKLDPQNVDKWYTLIKSDMETLAKMVDMGFEAYLDSLPSQ